ncbi:MAG: hypothetical protein GX147_08570 [Deltaproteobacteria bacterium]|jgi:hypothetical protein|nr:hypothetical protein [Deltaproteobacteria bacterium]
MKTRSYFFYLPALFIFAVLALLIYRPAAALSPSVNHGDTNEAAMRLVRFCMDPRTGFDEKAAAVLINHVLTPKKARECALPELMTCPGAYYEFDTKIAFPRFMDYSYTSLVPSVMTRPSSLRYSLWRGPRGESQSLPAAWKKVPSNAPPVILHGLQHDSNTPDLTTGVYYEYDLKRTLILLNHEGRQVLISVSKQTDQSNVGEQGFILGHDNDWNYYYSGRPGSARTGLGWVKSYIYDYFSVNIYVESGTSPAMVRTGGFQWIKAGWSGINFVKPSHIIQGMKRFAQNTRMILESPRLPASNQMASVFHWLTNLPDGDLSHKYMTLQRAQRVLAAQTGKINKAEAERPIVLKKTSKEQMIEELMLEYLKLVLGKPTSVEKHFSFIPPGPLS